MRSVRAVLSMVVMFGVTAVSVPAAAQNLDFLAQGPTAFFNDEDWRLFREAVDTALDDTEDLDEVRWENPVTHARGGVEPLRTTQSGDRTCRQVRIHNFAQSRSSRGVFRFCKEGEGEWDFAKR